MHTDRFPAPPGDDVSLQAYSKGPWSPAELDPPPRATSRRQWLVALLGVGIGGLAVSLLRPGRVSAGGGSTAGRVAPDSRPEPGWLTDMLELPEAELIRQAGDFERVSRSHLDDERVADGFERLLRAVLRSRRRERDMAGACAVRTLGMLGRADIVRAYRTKIAANDLPQTASEVRQLLTLEAPARRR
jgi:hypothetical protein